MHKITIDHLRKAGACVQQRGLFQEKFPDGAEVSEEVAASVAGLFDWDWASKNILHGDYLAAYEEAKAPLWTAYEEATAPLWTAYEEATAPLLTAYKEAEAPLWSAYEEAEAPLWSAYKEAEAPLWSAYKEAEALLWSAYEEAEARLFARIYLQSLTEGKPNV